MTIRDAADAVLSSARAEGPIFETRFGVLQPLAFDEARLAFDGFLGEWQTRNDQATIAHLIENMESSGVLHNFRRVADGEPGPHIGMDFSDSDLYKTLEAIGWESGRRGEKVEPEFVDMAIDLIGRTQREDGYINSRVQGDPNKSPWSNLIWSHELYCAGHLMQASVALSRGAGDDRLLRIAERFAYRIMTDLADRPEAFDGHAEVETALVELYRHTRDERYLEFARTQIERRGHGLLPKDVLGRDYFGDHQPIEEVDEATGHAVRQLYYMTGATDVYLETGERRYLDAARRIWDSAYATKTYVTGGQGSRHYGEAFGDPYELPADRAYAETCAGIASFHWNWRMLLATGEGKYAAEMERVLYNTIGASVGQDGCHFFYTNPLQLRTGHRGSQEGSPNERLSWFECACCPPNLARLIAALHSYLATRNGAGIQLHHLSPGELNVELPSGPAAIQISGDYPWSDDFALQVQASGSFELAVRVPDWAREVSLAVNGVPEEAQIDNGYLRLTCDWSQGVELSLSFGMRADLVYPHPRIDAVRGSAALRRGPLVYCLESADYGAGALLEDLRLDPAAQIEETTSTAPAVKVALRTRGRAVAVDAPLYTGDAPEPVDRAVTLTAIPYFAWGNRGQGAMRVWIPLVSG
jgi:DUF1680 family protein